MLAVTRLLRPAVRARLAKLDIAPDVVPAPALHTKLESEIENWTRFNDAKGIKPQ